MNIPTETLKRTDLLPGDKLVYIICLDCLEKHGQLDYTKISKLSGYSEKIVEIYIRNLMEKGLLT